MPKPSDVHINRALENILIAYLQDMKDYAVGNVFPYCPVDKESDSYFLYDIGDTSRLEVKERAPSTESVGLDWAPTSASYGCKEHMVHHDVDDRVASNADAGLEDRKSVGLLLDEQMMLYWEKMFADNFFKTSTWTGSSTGSDITPVTKWNNSGDAVKDVRAQAAAMKRKTKKKPNVLIVPPLVHEAFLNNSTVVGRMPTTDWRIPTEMDLAKAFDVDKYIVARASYNSAAKGATNSMTDIFTTSQALLCYAAPAPSRFAPSAGYTFVPTTYGGNAQGIKAWEYYIDQIHSTRYEMGMLLDMKLVSATLGVFFDAVLT